MKGHKDCELCHKHFDSENVEITDLIIATNDNHNWGNGTVTKQPTCTEAGEKTFTCTLSSDHTKTESIKELGHDKVQHEAKPATCTEKGWNAYETCSRCDYTTYAEITALGHTEEIVNAKAPTCTESGLTAGKRCSVCNSILEGLEPVGALGHNYGEWTITIPASCTEKGEETRICAHNSEHKETKEITALGHSYGEWVVTKEATIDVEGEEKRVCENDATHFETRTTPKLSNSKNSISGGAIVGITLGILIVLLLAAYIMCYFLLYRKEILLKGKVWDILYTPMNAIFKKKDSDEENEVDSVSEDD